MLGGRTNHWARNSFRMGPYDFKPKTRDGLGVDWPISYEDLAPWYDKTETVVGVYGTNDGLENHPDSAPGVLHTPPKPRVGELLIKAAAEDLGIPCVPARRAVLTRPIGDRSACFYATSCGRGCSIGAAFQTPTSLLPMALATGKLDIVTDAMVYEVRVSPNGKAEGVRYIDKTTGQHREASARTVVLAASAGETARILLNSKSALFPDGAANSSGQVGRNLMDTVGAGMGAQFPLLENRPRYNEDGAMGMHLYIPFWLYQEQARGELDFPRGYHYELAAREFRQPGMWLGDIANFAGSYGKQLKEDMRRYYGSFMYFTCRGEMIPNADSYCEIDPDETGQVGHPDAPLPLQVVGARAQHGDAFPGDDEADHRAPGRQRAIGRCFRGNRDLRGRTDHPRGGHDPHGRRPGHLGHQSIRPVLGHRQSVHHRRRRVREQGPQEPDTDHPGTRLAQRRLSRRTARQG